MACWPNGKASDYESGDCRFDPCVGQINPISFLPNISIHSSIHPYQSICPSMSIKSRSLLFHPIPSHHILQDWTIFFLSSSTNPTYLFLPIVHRASKQVLLFFFLFGSRLSTYLPSAKKFHSLSQVSTIPRATQTQKQTQTHHSFKARHIVVYTIQI